MFWKGTLLLEPREKPAHSHHPLLYTSPLTDTNLYLFCPPCLTFLALILSSVSLFLALYFCISRLSLYICILPLLVWPAGDLSFFQISSIQCFTNIFVEEEKKKFSVRLCAKCNDLWIYILVNQYFEYAIFLLSLVSPKVFHIHNLIA